MHTKFYFLLGLLVGFTSITSTLVSQTACFDTNQGENVPAGFSLTVETLATFDVSNHVPTEVTFSSWLRLDSASKSNSSPQKRYREVNSDMYFG